MIATNEIGAGAPSRWGESQRLQTEEQAAHGFARLRERREADSLRALPNVSDEIFRWWRGRRRARYCVMLHAHVYMRTGPRGPIRSVK